MSNTNLSYSISDYSDIYTEHVIEKYDLQSEETRIVNIPLINKDDLESFDWNIGLICGSSGSGKSTILKEQFNDSLIKPTYNNDKPIVSQFDNLTPKEVCDLFESMGLSSIPIWLHTPNQLSVGEKARFDLCWQVINTPKNLPIVIDEFTSTINRECAKSMAYTLQRYIRQNNLRIILSSCHFDIIEYLNPDWIYNLNKQNKGTAQIEHILYSSTSYNQTKQVNQDDVLTAKMSL